MSAKFPRGGEGMTIWPTVYDLNVQDKPTSSECNSSIGFFSPRASNGKTWEVWLLSEKQYGDMHWGSDGGYLRRGVSPYKFMLSTWNFQNWKTKDSAWLPYKYHYWASNSFDLLAPVRVIFEQPSYILVVQKNHLYKYYYGAQNSF